MGEMGISKLEGARRHIEAAIRLLLTGEDPIAVHTLMAAGFRVVRDVADAQGVDQMQRALEEAIKPGQQSAFGGK